MFVRSKKKIKIKELWESFFRSSLKHDWQRARPLLLDCLAEFYYGRAGHATEGQGTALRHKAV